MAKESAQKGKLCVSQLNSHWITLKSLPTAVDLWSNTIAIELPSPHIPSLLEPFLTVMGCVEMVMHRVWQSTGGR